MPYVRPTQAATPPRYPQQAPQPPIAPLTPPNLSVDLMTEAGSATMGARWKGQEAKIVSCPALSGSMPEFETTYDIEPHAEFTDFDDSGWLDIPPTALSARRGGGMVSFYWFRTELTIPAHIGDFSTAETKGVLTVNVDDYAEVWIDGVLPRTPGRPSPAAIQGFNMPNRLVLADSLVPGTSYKVAIFAINGPISAAPANFLWFREAKVEFWT